MIRPRTHLGAAALAALLALTTACNNGSAQDDGSSSSPSPSDGTSAAESPTEEKDPEDQAIADATDAVQRLYATENKLNHNPRLPLSQLKKVAAGKALKGSRAVLKSIRDDGLTVTGDRTLEIDKVLHVQLGKTAKVELQVCYDVTNVKVTDKNGNSAVTKDRLDRAIATYVVTNDQYKKKPSKAWIVTQSAETGAQSC